MCSYFLKVLATFRDYLKCLAVVVSLWFLVTFLSLNSGRFLVMAFKVVLSHIFLPVYKAVHPHKPNTLCSFNYTFNNNLILKYLNLIFTFHIRQYVFADSNLLMNVFNFKHCNIRNNKNDILDYFVFRSTNRVFQGLVFPGQILTR